MTTKQGMEIINFAVNKNILVKNFDICFFGGEPLLRFETLKEIIENIEAKYADTTFTYNITTNGTIISDKIINFLAKYKFSLLVSFDGVNNNRPFGNGNDSTSTVLNNIELLKNRNIPITIRATIVSNSLQICETFKYLERLQVPFAFSFAYNSANKEHNLSKYTDDELQSINLQLNDVVMYYEKVICENGECFCNTIKEALSDIHFKILSPVSCAAGFSNYTFNADGTIFTCQHFANEIKDSCGNITNGIDENKKLKYNAPFVDNIKDCSGCWARYLCGGCCFAEKYAQNGSILKNIPEKCELERMKWEKILILSQRIKENSPDFLDKLKQKYEIKN
jgi:uncharacterized protein